MQNSQQPQDNVSLWKKIKIIFATLLALFILILIVQNWNDININLVFGAVFVPLPLIIVVSLITGYLWGTFSSYKKTRRKDSEIRSLQRKVIDLTDKNAN